MNPSEIGLREEDLDLDEDLGRNDFESDLFDDPEAIDEEEEDELEEEVEDLDLTPEAEADYRRRWLNADEDDGPLPTRRP